MWCVPESPRQCRFFFTQCSASRPILLFLYVYDLPPPGFSRYVLYRLTVPMGSTEHFLVKGTLEERARDLLPVTALDKELADECSLAYSLFFKFIQALAAVAIDQGCCVWPDGTKYPHEGIDLIDMHNLSSSLNLYDHIEHAYANMSNMERPSADVVVALLDTVGVEALCKRGANIEFFAASLFLRRAHAYRDPRASDCKLTDFQNRRVRKEVGVQLTARLVGDEWDAATFMFHHDLDHSTAPSVSGADVLGEAIGLPASAIGVADGSDRRASRLRTPVPCKVVPPRAAAPAPRLCMCPLVCYKQVFGESDFCDFCTVDSTDYECECVGDVGVDGRGCCAGSDDDDEPDEEIGSDDD